METYSSIDDAIALAQFAHRNQRDKAGMPYIDHPLRVLEGVRAMGAQPYVQMAAVLHDVVEDTAFTIETLQQLGFAEPVLIVVKLVTRTDSVPKDEYYSAIKEHAGARMVKLADIRDNLTPWRLTYLSDETQTRLENKYAAALSALGA